MIHRTIPAVQGPDLSLQSCWQEQLRSVITCPQHLLQILGLNATDLGYSEEALGAFALRVTPAFVARMEHGNPRDPLLMQVLPHQNEMRQQDSAQWQMDPLAESHYRAAEGLIHKYRGRVLLIAAPQCAINCRYCFRRHFPYEENAPSRKEWQQSFNYIREDSSIEEVILSGGDPLVLSDRQLEWLIEEIENIEHVKRLRIHSRLPIVLPARLSERFNRRLSMSRLQSILVIHANHPNEIDEEVCCALRASRDAGITLLNQSVLLRGINDNCDIFTMLSNKLFECGVLPYYLHLLDKVKGASHFQVEKSEALTLYNKLRAQLPGYLVPQLVEEIPGADSKTVIA